MMAAVALMKALVLIAVLVLKEVPVLMRVLLLAGRHVRKKKGSMWVWVDDTKTRRQKGWNPDVV